MVNFCIPILDLFGHCQESLLNVGSILGRGLKERDVQLIGKFLRDPTSVSVNSGNAVSTDLCNTVFNDFLARQIGFVANEELINSFGGIAVDLLEPLLHVGESVCSVE